MACNSFSFLKMEIVFNLYYLLQKYLRCLYTFQITKVALTCSLKTLPLDRISKMIDIKYLRMEYWYLFPNNGVVCWNRLLDLLCIWKQRQLFWSDHISFKWYMSVGSIAIYIYMNVQYKSFILVTNVGHFFFSYKSFIFFLYTVNYILEIQSTLTTFWNCDYT